MPLHFRTTVAAAGIAGLVLALAACSSSGSSSPGSSSPGSSSSSASGASSGQVLTIGLASSSPLDPAGGCSVPEFCYPAYDTLIHQTSTGQFEADLATSWSFTNSSHTTLQLALRQGVKFTDGTTMTAAAVAASINNFLKTPGITRQQAGPAKDARAVGQYTVDIDFSTSVPLSFAETTLAQQGGFTMIVGPTGLANPKSLVDATDGVGPYKLDPSETTVGSVYTYVPNPLYFNQSAIKYSKIVAKVMQDPTSRLSAVESGQVDWAQDINLTDVSSAKSSGLEVSTGDLGIGTAGVAEWLLEDRTTGPLASQQVREALEYAIPRSAINTSLYAGTGTPTSSVVPDGVEGYNPADTNLYPYDPAKAKQLLAAAGYPHGFTLTALDASIFDPNESLGQALASALSQVGVTLNLETNNNDPGEVIEGMETKKYQTVIYMGPAQDAYSNATVDFLPGSDANAFQTTQDSAVSSLVQQASSASTAAAENTDEQQITNQLDQLVYAVPIVQVPTEQAINKAVGNVPSQFETLDMDPFSPVSSQDWQPAS